MSFTGATYFVFLAGVFAGYWLFPRPRAQNWLIVVASFLFYAGWDYRFFALILGCSALNYLAALGLGAHPSPRARRAILTVAVVLNLGILAYFKYLGFLIDNLNLIAGTHYHSWKIILPLAISFHTFQSMAYTIDVYRGILSPCRDAAQFFAFSTFFPQLVAGPIERAKHLLPQFSTARVFDAVSARQGCRRIILGFAKKTLIADNLAIFVQQAYDQKDPTGAMVFVGTLFFAFQIYCDFSGYSDIAIGSAKLFSIELNENFRAPYFSSNPAEFWRRWHISLSTWFRDYVYIPLGGDRHGRLRNSLALLLTFLVSGLWHGASWNFVVWGAFCGLTVWGYQRLVRPRGPTEPGTAVKFLGVCVTFALTCFAWVFFRASSLPKAFALQGAMLSQISEWMRFRNPVGLRSFLAPIQTKTAFALVLLLLVWELAYPARRGPYPRIRFSPWVKWFGWTTVVWTTLYFGRMSGNSFIYFQF